MSWTGKAPNGHRWGKVRRQVLNRDDGLCQLRHPGCTIDATEVHHLYGVNKHQGRDSEDAMNPDTCISVCTQCHSVETKRQATFGRHGQRKRPTPKHPSEG